MLALKMFPVDIVSNYEDFAKTGTIIFSNGIT